MTSSRREFLTRCTILATGAFLGAAGRAHSEPASAGPADPALIEDLVAANRILASEGVVDGYGHVSARHDKDPNRYLLARSMAPELVTAADIVEFDLDSNAVDPRGRKLYLERFIHGEIYKARPDVKAVVHHHSPAVIPFGVSTVPMRPIYHMAAFVAQGVPVFEIRQVGGMTDMLVRTPELGRALARTLGNSPAALMRGHGAVVVGVRCRRPSGAASTCRWTRGCRRRPWRWAVRSPTSTPRKCARPRRMATTTARGNCGSAR